MENREAIENLRYLSKAIDDYVGLNDKGKETFALAISALEKQEIKPFQFVVGQPVEMFFNGEWVKGKIVKGYRFNDGVVTIETENGSRLWCGQDRTDIYRLYQEDEA